MIQDLEEYHHQVRMALLQLVKEFLQVAKKLTNALHGQFKQTK